jgi:hypothetical protein
MNRFLFAALSAVALFSCSLSRASDLSITASAVVPSANAVKSTYTAGATITAGQLIYLDTADVDAQGIGKAKLSDANGATALRVVDGIAINSASAGQSVTVVTYDPALVIAASGLTANTILISSATAGGVAPSADLTTGWYLTVIGVVKSGTTIFFRAPGHVSGAAS